MMGKLKQADDLARKVINLLKNSLFVNLRFLKMRSDFQDRMKNMKESLEKQWSNISEYIQSEL